MGLISRISSSLSSMFGASRDAANLEAWEQGRTAHPAEERRIITNPYPPPYQSPAALDRHAGETSEMRLAYLKFYAVEPAFQSAIDGKVAAIASLDVSVLPEDENSEKDKRAAEFVRDAVANCPGGWPGLFERILRPAFLNGYSVTEKVLDGVAEQHEFIRLRRKWSGLWAPRVLAEIDTEKLRFQLDETRRIIGVVNTVRGLEGYSPDRVMIYTNRKLFENPYGRSDGRSAYRACQLIENAYKLWYIAVKNYSAPFLMAKSKSQGKIREALSNALQEARAGGWIVVGETDELELLNFASSTSFGAFESKVDKCRQEIYMAVRGAFLPFLEGMQQDGRGDTETHKVASDTIESMIVQGVLEVINQQLVPDLTLPNFGDSCGIPTVTLGGTNWSETKTQLEVINTVEKTLGRPVSTKHIYKISQLEPPRDGTDGPPPPPAPPAMPPGGGLGFMSAEQFGDVVRAIFPARDTAPATPAASPFQAALSPSGPIFSGESTETFAGPPGPPPHPGLVWKDSTHRWVLPEQSGGGSGYKPANKPSDDAHAKAQSLIQENHANPHMRQVHHAFVAAATSDLSGSHISAAANAMKNLGMHELRALKTFYGVGGTSSNKNPMIENILAAVQSKPATAKQEPKPKADKPANAPKPETPKPTEKKPVTPQLPPPTATPSKIDDASGGMPAEKPAYEVVKALGGSTGAKLVTAEDGTQYVMKDGSQGKGGKGQLRSEVVADSMYRAAGIKVPPSKLYGSGNDAEKLSEYIAMGQTLAEYSASNAPAKLKEIHKKLQEGFAADALFANWDVIGLANDNVLIYGGNPYRIDNGGSLTYRAKGGTKPFNGTVEELYTLRNASTNPNAAKVFGSMTDVDVANNIKDLLKKKTEILAAAKAGDIYHSINNRMDYMETWADGILKNAAKDSAKPKAAHEPSIGPTIAAPNSYSDPGQTTKNFKVPTGFSKQADPNDFLPAESRPNLTKEEAQAIFGYTGSAYSAINQALRTGAKLTPAQQRMFEGIQGAASKAAPFKKPTTVWRGISGQNGSNEMLKAIGTALANLDSHVTLKGITSTSTSESFAKGWGSKALIEIEAVHGLDAKPYSDHEHENEMLLPHESRFEIVSYNAKGHSGAPYIKLKQLPPKGA